MKSFHVKDLGQSRTRTVTSSFVVVDKGSRKTKRGKAYLSLVLADRTGQVGARVWNNAEYAFRCFESGNIIETVAKIEYYSGKFQLIVERFRRCDPSALDLSDYPPGTTGMPDDFSTLKEFFSAVGEWVDTDASTGAKQATEKRIRELVVKYSSPTPTSPSTTNEKRRPAASNSPTRPQTPVSSERLDELKRKYLRAYQETNDF